MCCLLLRTMLLWMMLMVSLMLSSSSWLSSTFADVFPKSNRLLNASFLISTSSIYLLMLLREKPLLSFKHRFEGTSSSSSSIFISCSSRSPPALPVLSCCWSEKLRLCCEFSFS